MLYICVLPNGVAFGVPLEKSFNITVVCRWEPSFACTSQTFSIFSYTLWRCPPFRWLCMGDSVRRLALLLSLMMLALLQNFIVLGLDCGQKYSLKSSLIVSLSVQAIRRVIHCDGLLLDFASKKLTATFTLVGVVVISAVLRYFIWFRIFHCSLKHSGLTEAMDNDGSACGVLLKHSFTQ